MVSSGRLPDDTTKAGARAASMPTAARAAALEWRPCQLLAGELTLDTKASRMGFSSTMC